MQNTAPIWISTQNASLLTGKVTKTIYRWADDGALHTRQENGRHKSISNET
ncbi:hypothetical protein AB4090_05760 [Acidithiobacillus sp. IBUN Pt1247-S3]|uniref:hypothetical protein n=1 Tax=Acidithiobacillus sp. IBUN Pt1247-S3 TaxID=3166642 RepID=UPI0034E3EF77